MGDEWEGTWGDPRRWQEHEEGELPGAPAVAAGPPRSWRRLIPVCVIALVLAAFGLFNRADHGNAADSFSFIRMQADGETPVTFNHCVPLGIYVNARTGPTNAVEVVKNAARRISLVSGFDISVAGTTDLAPTEENAGPGAGLILVAWSDPQEEPGLEGKVLGLGGAWRSTAMVDGRNWFTRGQVALDGPSLAGLSQSTQEATVMHELGHVLGLGHVKDRGQLMDPAPVLDDWGPGDLAGLRQLGSVACPR